MAESGGGRVIGRLVAIIDGDLSGLQRAISGAQTSLQTAGRSMTNAGRALSLGVTAPLLAIGGIAAKASIDFESAFAGVIKTVDATESQLGELRQGIRDMAKEVPASAVEIAKVAEAAGQLGVQTESILDFTRVMIDLGETTNLTADQAATAFAQIANVMQLPQDQFDEMGAALVDLGNKGASTEADIIEMAKRIAGAGATIGLSTADVLGLGAALANVGIEAEAGGSAISRTMITIANAVATGGEGLEEFATVAGMSADEFAAAFESDPAQAMASFIEGLSRLDEEGVNVFQTLKDLGLAEIRVRDALLRSANAGDIFRNQIEISNQAWQENSALTEEAARRYETTAAKLEVLKNKMMDAAITLGDALVPAFMSALDAAGPLLDAITFMAEGFAALPRPVQTAIVALAAVAAVIGPLLIIVGSMATGVSALLAILPVLGAALAVLGPIFIAAFPWIAIIAGLVALGVAIYVFRDEIVGALKSALSFAKEHWREIATILAGPFAGLAVLATDGFGIRTALLEALGSIKDKALEVLGDLAGAIGGALSDAGSAIAGAFESAKDAVGTALSSLADFIVQHFTAENLGKAVAYALLWPVVVFREAFSRIVPVLATFFTQTLPQFFTSTVPQLATSVATTLATAITTAVPAAVTAAMALGTAVINAIGQAMTVAWEGVKTFFTVTLPTFITETIPAVAAAALEMGKGIIQGIADGVTAAWDLITSIPGAVGDALEAGFDAMKNLWEDIGKGIVEGVWNGIKSLEGWFRQQVENFFEGIVDGVKGALGIDSPSKVFARVGRDMMLGLEQGLNRTFSSQVMPLVGAQALALAAGYAPTVAVPGAAVGRGFASVGSESSGAGAFGGGGGDGTGAFNFTVHQMTVNEVDDREIRDVAFGVQATLATELRRRGVLRG